MTYIDGMVVAVRDDDRALYIAHALNVAKIFRDHGALQVVDCWGDDVPDGKVTSFPMAVQKQPGETVVFSWVSWPSKAVRDAGWPQAMADPRMAGPDAAMPFDGKRMIFGGFQMIVDA